MKIEKENNETDNEIKILYENKKYELNEQELDRIIVLASKMLRYENAIDFINFEDEIDEVAVFRQGHRSELYGEMKAELVYALKEGMFDNYEKKKAKEESKQKAISSEVQKQTRQTKQLKQIIPIVSPIWRVRTISNNIFKPVYSLD